MLAVSGSYQAAIEQYCPFESQKVSTDIKHFVAVQHVTPLAKEPCCEGLCLGFALECHQYHTADHLQGHVSHKRTKLWWSECI